MVSSAKGKAEVFGTVLKSIFSEDHDNDFDKEHFKNVEDFIATNKKNLFTTDHDELEYDKEFNELEVKEVIKLLKRRSAPGTDGITNKHIINLPESGIKILTKITNLSWNNHKILDEWKVAQITMIEKKAENKHNPSNYRPISLTNSIIQLIEKLIKVRLSNFLDNNNILSKFQSGFRAKRQTTDNMVYFIQKVKEAKLVNKRNKACGVVFDIAKAFDKVWHNGLIFKLHEYKLPWKLGQWITNFLENRKFKVKVESEESGLFNIETSVMQGSILSPILFSLYINDILELKEFPNHNIQSLLFADDLFSFNIDFNDNRIFLQMQRYLKSLEVWLNKWRMKIAPNKCSFNIYCGNVPNLNILPKRSLIMFSENIPLERNPKYLGVTLDKSLKFSFHTKQIRMKCNKLLNILKNLSFKSWALEVDQQLVVYKTLIRSCMEYASQVLIQSKNNIQMLQIIQNKALRIIYKQLPRSSSEPL